MFYPAPYDLQPYKPDSDGGAFMIELVPLESLTLGVHDDPAYSHNLWTQDHPGRSP